MFLCRREIIQIKSKIYKHNNNKKAAFKEVVFIDIKLFKLVVVSLLRQQKKSYSMLS